MINPLITAVVLGLSVCSFTSCAKSVAYTTNNDVSILANDHDDIKCVTREYENLPSFDAIDLWTGVDVTYQVGSPAKAVVTVSDNVADRLIVEVKGDKLSMGLEDIDGKPVRRFKIKAVVTGPDLTSVKVSNGASFNLSETEDMGISGSTLSLYAISGGNIVMKGGVKYEKISAEALSGSNIKLLSTSGIRKLRLSSLSGAGVDIHGIDAEYVSASSLSGAEVSLSGDAEKVSLSASSGGKIFSRKLVASTGSANATSSGSIVCSIRNPSSLNKVTGGSIANNKAEND